MTEIIGPKLNENRNPLKDFVQYIFIRLADGRKGVFIGPAFLSEAEIKLQTHQIVEILFSPPKLRTPLEVVNSNENKESLQPQKEDNSSSTPDMVV